MMIKRTIAGCLVAGLLIISALAATHYDQTTAEADATLVSAEGIPHDAGFVLIRSWPRIAVKVSAGNAIDDLFTTLNAITNYTNPKANNETYTGSFINSETRAEDDVSPGDSARRGVIIQTLTKVKTTVSTAGLGVNEPAATEERLNFLQFQEGDKSLRFHTYRNLDPRKMESWLNVAVTESGHTLVRRDFNIEKNRTGTLLITFETNTWTNVSSSAIGTQVVLEEINVSGIQRKQNKGADGITKVEALNVRDNLTPTSGWFEDRNTLTEKANGEFDVRLIETKARGTNDQIATRFIPSTGRQEEQEWYHWYNLTLANSALIFEDAKSNADDMTSATYRTAPASHKLRSINQIPNPNGSYDIDRVTYIPLNSSSANWPETGGGISSTNTIFIQVSASRYRIGDSRKVRYIFAKKDIIYTDSYTNAWSLIPSTKNGSTNLVYMKGTGVTRIGSGKYKVIVIKRVLDNSAIFEIGDDTADYKSNLEAND